MIAGGAVLEQVADLCECPVDADDLDDVGVDLGHFEATGERCGQHRAGEGGDAQNLLHREDRHETGNDGNGDAGGAALVHEAVIDRVVEKQLGGHKRSAGVHLALEVVEIDFHGRSLGVFLGVTSDSETEVWVALFKKSDEFVGVAEAVGRDGELGGALGRIAAERHDVAETVVVNQIGERDQFGAAVSDTGQMRHHREAEVFAEQAADLGGALAGGAAGAIGHGYEIPLDRLERGGGLAERINAGIVLGWKKLERTKRAIFGEERGDAEIGIHDASTYSYLLMRMQARKLCLFNVAGFLRCVRRGTRGG